MWRHLNKKKYFKIYYNKLKFIVKKKKYLFSRIKNLIRNFVKKIPTKFIRVFIILGLSFFSVLIFINREKFSPDYVSIFLKDFFAGIQQGQGYPYKMSGNKIDNENFKIIDKNLFLLNDNSFTVLNTSAKEMQKKQHCYQKPILKLSDTRAIIYDLGGKGIEITSKSQSLHTGTMENNIISGAVSNYGTFAIVTESKGYLSQMTVFDKNGKDIYYKYNFADHYITDVALNENGNSVAVCGSMAKDGSMVSTIYVFDYRNEEPKVKLDYDNNMFIRIEYLSNGNIVAVGDRLISVINPKNGSKEDYFYENKNLIGFDINKSDGVLLALSLSEDGNNTTIVCIDKKGKAYKSFNTDHSVKAVSFNDGKIALLSYGKVYVYNFSGKRLKLVDVGTDAKNIRLFSNRDIYILGITEVRKIRF